MLSSTSSSLPCSSLRPTSSARISCAGGDLRCTGRYQPIRSSWAMPRASLRSVFTTIAESAAFTCRVSSSTASNPAPVRPGVQPLRERPGLQPDPGHRQAELAEEPDQRLRLARHLGLAHDLARRVDHAHAAPFQRDVDPGIVLHGCPSMMPGADPLGPRTHHHSEGQPPRRSLRRRPITASRVNAVHLSFYSVHFSWPRFGTSLRYKVFSNGLPRSWNPRADREQVGTAGRRHLLLMTSGLRPDLSAVCSR